MLCKIIGDSIALGLALANPQCHHNVAEGRATVLVASLSANADKVVVSAGSNVPTKDSYKQLYTMRKYRIKAQKVTWILPINSVGRNAVIDVARNFGDLIVDFKPKKDNVHPRSYKLLSRTVHNVGGL